jgi:hypothetical protein
MHNSGAIARRECELLSQRHCLRQTRSVLRKGAKRRSNPASSEPRYFGNGGGLPLPLWERVGERGEVYRQSATPHPDGICRCNPTSPTRGEVILSKRKDGLLRGACHRARIRATRWLAMTGFEPRALSLPLFPANLASRGHIAISGHSATPIVRTSVP